MTRYGERLECLWRWRYAVSWLPGIGAILVLGALMIGLLLGLPLSFRTTSEDGRTMRVRTGRVESVRYWQARKDQPVPTWYTTVRVDGFTIPVKTLREYRPGDRVRVDYLRGGPWGSVVVERIEPVTSEERD